MYTCDYCGREFGTIQALGGHIGKSHPREKSGEEISPRGKDTQPCPVCGFKLKWTTAIGEQITVCPHCLCWYHLDTGNINQPPPKKCIYELSGLPCPNLQHQVYYRRYQDALVSSQ